MPKIRTTKEEAKQSIKELERERPISNKRKVFKSDLRLDSDIYHKLTLVSFLEGNCKAVLGRNTIEDFLDNWEEENGDIIKAAKEILNDSKKMPCSTEQPLSRV